MRRLPRIVQCGRPRPTMGSVGLLSLASMMTLGCIMPDDIKQIEKDVADVKAQLRVVQRSQEDVDRKLIELATGQEGDTDAVTRDELLDLKLQTERLARESSINSERLIEMDQRFDRISQQFTQKRQSLGPRPDGDSAPVAGDVELDDATVPSGRGNSAIPDPEALYNTAYADFSKGNYSLAISGFEEFQERYNLSPMADNALYWIAECHFSQADYGPAIDALDKLLDRYPDSDKAPSAHLKKALAFQEQNQIQRAIVQYQFVVAEYPDTDEGRLARDKLAGLGHSN